MSKPVIHIEVNGLVLKWARESIFMSKSEAIKRLEISAKRLDSLESGDKLPSLQEVQAMSKLYKRTIATLLLNKPPKEKPLPKDCRTIDSKRLNLFHEKTVLAVRKARAMSYSLLELRQELGIKTIKFNGKASLNDNPIDIANKYRNIFEISKLQFLETDNLFLEGCIEKIEELGIAIFQLGLTQDGLRGFSLLDEDIPIIAIKRGGEKPQAKVFSLFHEFGHILLNEGGLCDMKFLPNELDIEKWCNSFAAEILVPSSELLNQDVVVDYHLNNRVEWRHKDLVELGNKFHVGPLVILRRLLTLGRTSVKYYNSKHEQWNKPTFGRSKNNEGRNIAKEAFNEKGRGYISLVFKAYDANIIDIKDVADYIGVKLPYIPKTRLLLTA